MGAAFRCQDVPHVFWDSALAAAGNEGLAICSGDSQSDVAAGSDDPTAFDAIFPFDFDHPITMGLDALIDADGFLTLYDSPQTVGWVGSGISARCPAALGELAPGARQSPMFRTELIPALAIRSASNCSSWYRLSFTRLSPTIISDPHSIERTSLLRWQLTS